jgi:hypothetical protein
MKRCLIIFILLIAASNSWGFGFGGGGGGGGGGASTASAVSNTPSGSITATSVQGAIEELDDEKQRIAADEVYATDYNGGALNSTTINAALTAIGASAKTLVLTPGDWAMSASITVPANVVLKMQPAAKIVRSSGTLTINGPVDLPRQTVFEDFAVTQLVLGPKVKIAYVDWVDVAADGVTDDATPLAAILRSVNGADVEFTQGKSYYVGSSVFATANTSVHVKGNGSTVIFSGSDSPTFWFGWPTTESTGLAIAMSKNSNTFTIPGGVTLTAGDMVNIYDSTPERISGYNYGVLTNIVAVNGPTATIDILPAYDFTADTLRPYRVCDQCTVEGLNIDNTASTNNSSGIKLYGRNFTIKNNWCAGSEQAAIGITAFGINGTVESNITTDYLSKITTAGASRYGDGIAVAGHNIEVKKNVAWNSKHGVTVSDRTFISNNITVTNNTLAQDQSRFGETYVRDGNTISTYSGVMDIHANAENVVAQGNELDGAGIAAVTVRNGKAVFRDNRIRYWNNTATGVGVFMVGEDTLQSLILSGNDIEAETASTPLMVAADGSWLHAITVASPVYADGIDVNVKQDGTNRMVNIATTTAFPTLANTTLPTVCANGQIAVDTNATTGRQVYACESGAWVVQSPNTAAIGIGTGSNTNTILGTDTPLLSVAGTLNTIYGRLAGAALTTGTLNTALGTAALTANDTGGQNVAIGSGALLVFNPSDTRGLNVAVGVNAGSVLTGASGSVNNTFIGAQAGSTGTLATVSNAAAIGYNAQVAASNTIQLGDTNVTSVKTATTFSAPVLTSTVATGTAPLVIASITEVANLRAATSTALAANGSNCSTGYAPLGVDASGAVEGCFAVLTTGTRDIPTAATSENILTTDTTVTIEANASGTTAVLPAPNTYPSGKILTIKNRHASNAVTVSSVANGGQIDAGTTHALAGYKAVQLISDTANWYIVGAY